MANSPDSLGHTMIYVVTTAMVHGDTFTGIVGQ